jgi:acyl-coenzyme A synthetase/AMP-(fatty) acid ligase
MNCVELFARQAAERPAQAALLIPGERPLSYAELGSQAAAVQRLLQQRGLACGDSVLVFDQLSYRLYAALIGMIGMGVRVLLIEPWMPVARIERVVELTRPKAFWCNWAGRLWGSRIKAIRGIPQWIAPSTRGHAGSFAIEDVPAEHPGIVAFTSGTTGDPKGVSRTHGYLEVQHRVLSRALHVERHSGPDLCIFANFALSNLAAGRTSILVPSSWGASLLERLWSLPSELQPVTTTCGPAFLLQMLRYGDLPRLQSIHVGGALTDCWILEEAFRRWPGANIEHVYGSSEVEPVAHGDARRMVAESRARGFFQTLALGQAAQEIEADFHSDGLWVAGPHVSPKYVGNQAESNRFKKLDEQGRLWHFMGDRIERDGDTLWYSGRSAQTREDFALEQSIYQHAQSSTSFVHRTPQGKRVLIGRGLERVLPRLPLSLRDSFDRTFDVARIRRDRRHRARIDRLATIHKELSSKEQQWLLNH